MRLCRHSSCWRRRGCACRRRSARLGRRSDRQRSGDVHADGRQPRRRGDAGPPDRGGAGRRGVRRRSEGAVLGLGARDDDRPVQGGDGRQAELHRDHGPSGRDRLPRSRQTGDRPGHRRHRRQLADDLAAGRVRHQGLRLCGRRPLRGRRADRPRHAGEGAQVRRRSDGLRRLQPGRARPVGEGARRHAGEGRPEGRPARDQPGGQLRHVARRADSRRLHPGAPQPQGDRHPARRRDRHPAAGAAEGRQEAGRHRRRRHRPRAGHDRRPEVEVHHRHARPAALSAGLHAGRAVRDDRQVQDAGPVAQHRRRRRHPARRSAGSPS